MKFSIITICKNAEESIRRTMDSVLNQRYSNYEYIIIDGASEDGTVDILHSCSNPHIRITSESDRGISDAFNKGIEKSSGDILFFLNSGDYFIDDGVLEMVAADIEKNQADIYTYSITSMINPKSPENKKEGKFYWENFVVPHQGTFIKRKVFAEVGLYNENFKVRMDYDFFCRCYKAGKRFYCNPIVITHYDTNGLSSADKYLFEKEGLAVRLLYQDKVSADERVTIDFLADGRAIETAEYLKKIEDQKRLIEKDHKIIVAMYKWLQLLNGGYSPAEYFLHHHDCNVAIYGYGMLGKILRTELLDKGIIVSYVIDRNRDMKEEHSIEEPRIISWEDEWTSVDCIVVTPFYAYKEIKEKIRQEKGRFVVVSLEDILEDLKETC